MIEKLLVAVDGSEHSLKAVDYASTIAAALEAELIICHVLKDIRIPDGLADYAKNEHMGSADGEILERFYDGILSDAKKRAVKKGASNTVSEMADGPVARTIVARAKHHGVDMIVIGSRGMGNIEATLRGGISHRVELLAKCPVLTVR